MAPALAPVIASMASRPSSRMASSTPQVKAPWAPPPCSASETAFSALGPARPGKAPAGVGLPVLASGHCSGPAAVHGQVGAGDLACRVGAQEDRERGDLIDGDELLGRLRASSTSLMTCSLVRLRAFMVSGICFSTSGVQT